MITNRTILLPKLVSILEEMGENIKLSRLRKKLTAEQVAELFLNRLIKYRDLLFTFLYHPKVPTRLSSMFMTCCLS